MADRKLILYIGMSLDGYIATKDDDISWLDEIDHGSNDYGYVDFTSTVDTYIVGRKTYDVVMKLTDGVFDQANKYKCYVLTRQDIEDQDGVTFYNGDIEALITKIKSEEGKNIYCDGGGEVVKLLMEKDLIDEYIISVMPVLLGNGKPLFKGGTSKLDLKCVESIQYDSGVVQLRYM
jgi:dihydrofolate reductase